MLKETLHYIYSDMAAERLEKWSNGNLVGRGSALCYISFTLNESVILILGSSND